MIFFIMEVLTVFVLRHKSFEILFFGSVKNFIVMIKLVDFFSGTSDVGRSWVDFIFNLQGHSTDRGIEMLVQEMQKCRHARL